MDGLPSNLTQYPGATNCTTRVLSHLAGFGLLSLMSWSGMQTIALAADFPNSIQLAQATGTQPSNQINLIFVHPNIGNDQTGNGTQLTPFKTISHALQVAPSNTVILLAPGTYSAQTGETFPLRLKPGVTLQGNPHIRGQNTLILGGGGFLSPSFANQNVTIVGANQAGLTGVTVTNPNPQGYGLWLESASPLVIDNIFTANAADGIAITGNSAPVIRNNYFYQNSISGIAVYGTSKAEIRQNLFESTGFGINIAQNATPLLIGNRIRRNTDGVVVQANARPILRGNVIEENGRDGLVATANAQPDLGIVTEPGGNLFRNNGRLDVNATAISRQISAFGNQLNTTRIGGQVDLLGATAVKTPALASQPDGIGLSSALVAMQANAEVDQTKRVSAYPSRPVTQPVRGVTQSNAAQPTAPSGELTAATFPVPASLNATPLSATQPGRNQFVVTQTQRSPNLSNPNHSPRQVSATANPQLAAIPIAVPPPENNRQSAPLARPVVPASVAVASTVQPIVVPPTAMEATLTDLQTVVVRAPAKRFQPPVPIATGAGRRTVTGRRSLPAPAQLITANSSTPTTTISIAVPPPESDQVVPVLPSATLDTATPPPISTRPDVDNVGTNLTTSRLPGGGTPGLLPVPGPDIPLGNGESVSNFVASRSSGENSEPPTLPGRVEALGLRYRVVVEASSEEEQLQVKALVPNAFQAFSGGRSVMQVGAFGDRANAEQLQQMLSSQGLRATVESLE
ncbi:MAG: DUF1565 domain-containing protein [Scytolyngbya sp. HA4215-MV1]|nr:DUF1565 domain-containing protein [Scytolyngbya sp. HA4215-MV1]